MIIEKFDIEHDYNRIFNIIECHPKDENYNFIFQSVKKMVEVFDRAVEPICIYEKDDKSCENIVYIVYTIGDKTEKIINELFEKCEYMNGIILNAIADSYLMSMDRIICREIEKRHEKFGRRISAGDNVEHSFQKVICEKTNSDKFEIICNDSFVLTPSKTMAFALVTKNDDTEDNILHDCGNCKAVSCKWRKSDG